MTRAASAPARGPFLIALTGMVALAVAMGIGRFAFTPILPMMLHDGVVDLPTASWLASANYIGYLLGALLCAAGPWLAPRLPAAGMDGVLRARAGLAATAVLTVAMALPVPTLWPLWRFAAGVASAVVLVYSTGWCLGRLAAQGRSALGGLMFAGPGAGIVASGLVAGGLVAADARASLAWLVFGALATVLSASVWTLLRADAAPAMAAATPDGPASSAAGSPDGPGSRKAIAPPVQIACFSLAYGLAGFGYIVTATFLPVIARAALPGSPALDLFWPIFGAGAVAGALLSTRLRVGGDMRPAIAAAYAIQALGIFIGVVSPSEAGFALGSLLLGLPFTTITFFAMQEARRLRPQRTASTIGLLTATYGIGQIVGPPLVALLLERSHDPGTAFRLSLEIAASALLLGAALYVLMRRLWPALPASTPG
ncbi:MAG TPA: YbfB/YjiJ family MFS transporter [Caldimonas sp.]|nr:YbfB/YjiJ family MFS transporter [Caldimonas sp.]HEX2543022.1 YbfB/YjiJ family MFS transporter [Caldimonas sp.]